MVQKGAKVKDELVGNAIENEPVDVTETLNEDTIEDTVEDLGSHIDESIMEGSEPDQSDEESDKEVPGDLDRELTEEDNIRYLELISHAYKNTEDKKIIAERTLLANTILIDKFCKLLNTDNLGDYTDIKTLNIES